MVWGVGIQNMEVSERVMIWDIFSQRMNIQ